MCPSALCGPGGAGREGKQQVAERSRPGWRILRPPLLGEGDAPQTSRGGGTPGGAGVTRGVSLSWSPAPAG